MNFFYKRLEFRVIAVILLYIVIKISITNKGHLLNNDTVISFIGPPSKIINGAKEHQFGNGPPVTAQYHLYSGCIKVSVKYASVIVK